MKLRLIGVATATLFFAFVPAGITIAQEGTPSASIDVFAPFPGVAVQPGQSANFDIGLSGPPGERVGLVVRDVPEGWESTLRGGGSLITEVILPQVNPDTGSQDLNVRLEVEVPADAAEGSYRVSVVGTADSSTDTLELAIEVAAAVGGGVTLTSEFPALRGPAEVPFSYTLDLTNDTSEQIQFGLQATGPAGWIIDARPAGQSRASTVTLEPGESSRVTVDVDPTDLAPAGVYTVVVGAAGGGQTAEVELFTEITGNFAMELTTSDERLNVAATAGETSELDLVVFNTGTASLTGVEVSARAPSGWEIAFEPATISSIDPNGGFAEVTARITPSGDAIAGDYRISFDASTLEARDSIEVRATVETSLFWGFVGIAVIVAALAGLAWVFRRYGRR